MDLINAKAKEKGNGVYRFRGIVFRVHNKRVTHIAYSGKVFERCGHFNFEVAQCDGYGQAAKMLRKI